MAKRTNIFISHSKDDDLTRIGDSLADVVTPEIAALVKAPRKRKVPSASSAVFDRMVSAALDMQEKPNPDDKDKAFMAWHLVQCTLPHSDPGDVREWKRQNGSLTLKIRPVLDPRTSKYLYPYGTYPRLLLYWIVTEAVRTKSRKLYLGKSLAQFMRKLGLDTYSGGGKRGGPKRLHEQMIRLLRATISFEWTHGNGQSWVDMQIAPEGELWWSVKEGQDGLFESWVELGERFFKAVTTQPVVLDLRALRALKKSPLALDLYAWLAYKTWYASWKGEAQMIPWEGLKLQMGADYGDMKDFKKKVRLALDRIRKVYKAVKVDASADGLLVRPSRTAVEARQG
jgi:Plasmid encoded RepA protein